MKKKMKFELVSHEDQLRQDLKDPRFAAEYLKAAIAESAADLPDAVLIALRRVAEVQGMRWLSEKTGINRQALYQMLSEEGNPSIRNFMAIIHNLGIKMTFEPEQRVRPKRQHRSR
jgi:probable addiction module antidote protein